jgi:ABC-type phosphate transport system substrate-binding protein
MRVRSLLAGLATTAVTASAATMIAAAPASADPAATPDANDIVGVGSDTTENALDYLADGHGGIPGYNAGKTAADPLLVSFDTEGSATIVLRSGSAAITRPVGSGAGKALLYGGTNNPDVSFARSSSALNATEVSGGLKAFPFALDTLGVAVSGSVSSHAPAGLTGAQILDIYKGTTTNWSQVGGTAGTIKPYIPQAGSGTRSFFDAQLKALNGGVAVSYGLDVNDTMHENTDTVLASDPDAIAPFSLGKQQTLFPATVKMESLDNAGSGWSAQRALYDVVRSTDLADATLGPRLQAVFGEDGFVCSTSARGLIEAAGFQQLALATNGGVCGAATTDPTSNFTVNAHVATTTVLKATSTKARTAALNARVTGSTAPIGSVDFYEGATLVQSGVPLTSGQATLTVRRAPGTHTFTAKFVPDLSSPDDASQGSRTVFVKAGAAITESFPAKVAKGARAKGRVTVTLVGLSNKATGLVKVLDGRKVLAKGKLTGGKVTLKLARLSKGKHHLKAVWGGDAHGAAATKKFTITQR